MNKVNFRTVSSKKHRPLSDFSNQFNKTTSITLFSVNRVMKYEGDEWEIRTLCHYYSFLCMYRSGLPGFVNRKRIFIYLSNITTYLYAFKKYDFTHEDIPHGHGMAKFTAEIVPFYRCYIL